MYNKEDDLWVAVVVNTLQSVHIYLDIRVNILILLTLFQPS